MNAQSMKRWGIAAVAFMTAGSLYAAEVTDTTSKVSAATPTVGHPGTPFILHFDFAKSDLKLANADEAEFATIAQELANYPGAKVEIDGFTDSIGSDRYNQTLSED